MIGSYWPWWIGAIGLAATAVGYHMMFGRTFGFSGIWERVLFKHETDDLSQAKDFMTKNFPDPESKDRDPQHWLGYVFFSAGVLAGGIIAATSGQTFSWGWELSSIHQSYFGSGWSQALVLAGGGWLVGFGTRLAGGCTSGHGLNGCSQADPTSFIATVTFFGTAMLVTYVLQSWLGHG